MESSARKRSLFTHFLDGIERAGNRLPDPVFIFIWLCALILLASWVAAAAGLSAVNPATGKTVEAVNLLNSAGLVRIVEESVKNFSAFPPLGVVLATMIGVGVAERSGWFEAMMKSAVASTPHGMIIPVIILIGILGNITADGAVVVLPPLAAMIFIRLGYHPVAGLACAYATTVGAFSANLMVGVTDVLALAFTEPAAALVRSDVPMNPAMNYYFIAASTFLLLPVAWWVTTRIVIPRMGTWKPEDAGEATGTAGDGQGEAAAAADVRAHHTGQTTSATAAPPVVEVDTRQGPADGKVLVNKDLVTPQERKAMRAANIVLLVMVLVLLALTIPEGALLRNAETGSLIDKSPLMKGIIFIITLLFLGPGLTYALVAGTARNSRDIAHMMGESMATMGPYIVLVFFAAQMLAFFSWSNLGTIIAIKGAEMLSGQNGVTLVVGIVFLSASVNLLIGSSSAKWAILAPIFVPMMLLLNYHPAFTQMVYRVGDSITNPITPMVPYMALVLSYAQRYVKDLGLGTLIAVLMPYTIAFGISWTLMTVIWYLLGWPVGPGGPIHLAH